MANGTGRADKETVHIADKSAVITSPDELGDLAPERRDAYLKRLARENRASKKAFARVDQWIAVEGKKVLRKETNAAGSEYTHYLFNRLRYPDAYARMEREGGYEFVNGETGAKKFLPLRTVNGKEVARRGRG